MAFQKFATMYVKYILIFKKLEDCYDQVLLCFSLVHEANSPTTLHIGGYSPAFSAAGYLYIVQRLSYWTCTCSLAVVQYRLAPVLLSGRLSCVAALTVLARGSVMCGMLDMIE